MKKIFLSFILIVLFLMPFPLSTGIVHPLSISPRQSSEYEIITDAMLSVPLGWEPDSLNPVATSSAYDWAILGLLFDSLQVPNPYDYFNIEADINWVAESITYSTYNDGYIVWTIRLRNNIYFFDGNKVDAADVKFTYDFINWLGSNNDPFYDVWITVERAEIV